MSITRSNAGLRLGAAFACLATAGTIWAVCATQPAAVADDAAEPAAEASEPTKRYDSQADQSVFDNPATLEEYTANRTQRDADAATIYAAEVTTLEDGTQVQPVPNDGPPLQRGHPARRGPRLHVVPLPRGRPRVVPHLAQRPEQLR